MVKLINILKEIQVKGPANPESIYALWGRIWFYKNDEIKRKVINKFGEMGNRNGRFKLIPWLQSLSQPQLNELWIYLNKLFNDK